MTKRGTFLAAAAVAAVIASPASAQRKSEDTPAPTKREEPWWEKAPYERRGGFMVGIAASGMLASAAGFPNDPRKIGRERYYTATGPGAGATGALWIGAALADWFTFGIGFTGGGFAASGDTTAGGLFIFHMEAFPLYWRGGVWRELGAIAEAGAGRMTTSPSGDSKTTLIDSGAASNIGAGVFYEGLRFWKISTGPYAMADYIWSDSLRRPAALLGWRTVLYAAPKKDNGSRPRAMAKP